MFKSADKKFENTDEADLHLFHNKVEVTLDVRPIIDVKVDPFDEIMKSLAALKENEYLKIINYFKPVPLYVHLKRMGYAYHTRQHGMFYHISIIKSLYKKTIEELTFNISDHSKEFDEYGFLKIAEHHLIEIMEKLKKDNPEKIKFLDVSDLPAPEPFIKILETIKSRPHPHLLSVRHRKMPLHLPGFLKGNDYLVSAFEKNDRVDVYVFISDLIQKYG